MATASVLARLERIGQGALAPATGLSALAAALSACPATQLTVNPFAWDRCGKEQSCLQRQVTFAGRGVNVPIQQIGLNAVWAHLCLKHSSKSSIYISCVARRDQHLEADMIVL